MNRRGQVGRDGTELLLSSCVTNVTEFEEHICGEGAEKQQKKQLTYQMEVRSNII